MIRLAAWSIDEHECVSRQSTPKRVEYSHIGLEKCLEDWIVNDITLISEGLTLVGRQIVIDNGRLDLLAIDTRDRWVVIEIKPGELDSGALTQALYYASSLAHLDSDEFSGKLKPGLGKFGDIEQRSARVNQLLENEGNEREIAVLLVGAGIHPGLNRMKTFLGRFGIPISVVSFEVFELEGGPKLLIREVVDEPAKTHPPHRRLTVEAIRHRAVEAGVGRQFDRFVNIAQTAGLAVQPQRASIRVAPQVNRTRFLMYAQPRAGDSGGELCLHVGPKQFAEFYDDIDEAEATVAMAGIDGQYVGGAALDERLDRIEQFLTNKFPQSAANGK